MSDNKIPVALSIAGSDSGGGAGIQADIRVFSSLRIFPTTVITALTAQNPNEVREVVGISSDFVASQLQTVLDAFDVRAIKTGMLYSAEIIEKLCGIFSSPDFIRRNIPIVVDPVMISTSGAKLVSLEAIDIYKKQLLPLATVITPNIDEAEVLLDIDNIKIIEDNQLELAKHLQQKYNCAVLLKGGHLQGPPTDILIEPNAPPFIKRHDRIKNICTHGTGCSLSAAITAFLAKGMSLQEAVEEGLYFLQRTLKKPHLLHVSDEPLYVLGLENPKK